MYNKKLSILLGALVVTGVVLGSSAFAAQSASNMGLASFFDSIGHMFSSVFNFKMNGQATAKKSAAGPNGNQIFGKVVSVNGNTITVQGMVSETFTVDGSGAKITKVLGSTPQNISAGDIKAGDSINITGTFNINASGVTAIQDNGGPADHFVFVGNVTAVNGDSFTLERQSPGNNSTTDSYTVNTDSTTSFVKLGKKGSISDITVGASVTAMGPVDQSAKTISAVNVSINPANPLPPKPHTLPVPPK